MQFCFVVVIVLFHLSYKDWIFFLKMKINRVCREGSSWAGKLRSCTGCSVAIADISVQAGAFHTSPSEAVIWEH